ncbi:adenosine receptor A2a-like [Paramuricea clavata]|uniref:Adenosine receptor A2a-like n=1 Tax=Paramuricea clavata TaxID=317549 RepID=A0A6S7H2B2_PARCT|nr:adenosine receptor A2a-like [Paramuricea clavata]
MNNHSTERNGSTNNPIHSPNFALALMLAINVVGVLGNVLLIVAHVKDPLRVLKSPSSHFILSIASADALLSGVFMVTTAFTLASINTYWDWDTSYHSSIFLLLLLTSLLYSALFASYLSLAAERFLSVAYPLWHRVRVTTKVCRYWVIGLWLGLGGFRLIDFALTRIKETLTTIQSQLTLIVFMCILLMLTLSVYIASYISIRRQRMELQNRTSMSEVTIRTAQIRLENEKNFLVTIAIVCLALAATVLPFLIISFVSLVEVTNRLKGDDSKIVVPSYAHWGLLLIGLNSAANVFVYLWRLPKYRKTFKKLYCDC